MFKEKSQSPIGLNNLQGISRRNFMTMSALGLTVLPAMTASGCGFARSPHGSAMEECLPQKDMGPDRKKEMDSFRQKVFLPSKIGSIPLNNRIVKSAMALNLPGSGKGPSKLLGENYAQIAKGGAGLIITGCVAVHKNGRSAFENALILDTDELIPEFHKISEKVHAHNTPIVMQIGHDGPITRKAVTGFETMGPSAVADGAYSETIPQKMTELQIQKVIDSFVLTIERAKKAGFDGVQLFAAHGGLLSAFLSLATNKRTDKWGGTLENRFRIISKIFKKALKKDKDFPILAKINAYDFQDNGMDTKQAVQIASMLENAGCSGVEVSSGVPGDGFSTIRVDEFPTQMLLEYNFLYENNSILQKKLTKIVMPLMSWKYLHSPIYNYNVCAANEIKKKVDIPVIVVGGIRSIRDIRQIIGQDMADYVAMARPFITEPDIVNKFKSEEQGSSDCINCGHCILALEKREVE